MFCAACHSPYPQICTTDEFKCKTTKGNNNINLTRCNKGTSPTVFHFWNKKKTWAIILLIKVHVRDILPWSSDHVGQVTLKPNKAKETYNPDKNCIRIKQTRGIFSINIDDILMILALGTTTYQYISKPKRRSQFFKWILRYGWNNTQQWNKERATTLL